MNLQEIRASYPQYDGLSDQRLADALYRKHYAGKIDKPDFYKRIGHVPDDDKARALDIMRQPQSGGTASGRVLANQGLSDDDATAAMLRSERALGRSPEFEALNTLGEFVEGNLFGGADELLAGIHGAAAMMPGGQSPGEAFTNKLQGLEARREAFREDNAGKAIVANIAGAVVNPLNVIGGGYVAQGATLPARAGRAAATGAMFGAPAGFLSTQGDVGDRAIGAGIGAGVGAGVGAVAQPAAEGIAHLAGKLWNAGKSGVQLIANQRQAAANPALRAEELLGRAIGQDMLTPQQLQAAAQGALPDQALVNLGGPNLVALGRQATVAPGQGRTIAGEFLEAQQAGQGGRIGTAAQRLLGAGGKSLTTIDDLMARRSAEAAPAYQRFYDLDTERFDTKFIRNLVSGKTGKELLQRAYKVAQLEAARGEVPYNVLEPMLDAEGNLTTQWAPTARAMHYVKQALDDIVSDFTDQTTGRIKGSVGYQWDQLRRRLVGELNEASTVNGQSLFKAANDAYAGTSRMIGAVNMGRDWLKAGAIDEKLQAFGKLTASEKEAARVGYVDALLNRIGRKIDTADASKLLFGSKELRQLHQAMFPDQKAFQEFADLMAAERGMFKAGQTILGGSPTSRIDAEKAALSDVGDTIDTISALGSGNPLRLFSVAAERAKLLQQGMTPEVAEQVSKRLFTADKDEMLRILSGLRPQVPAATRGLMTPRRGLMMLSPLVGQATGRAAGGLMSE